MVWRRNVLLQLDPDHHCAVDPWYFGLDPQIRTSDSRIWIYIRIRLRIRDILVRIRDILVRIRRSEPLAQGSGFILGSGSGSVIFWSGSADLNHWLKDLDLYQDPAPDPWYFGPDPQIRTTTTESRSSLCCKSVIFWSGSADPNHWLKDLDLY
jgi:hypothetical protein